MSSDDNKNLLDGFEQLCREEFDSEQQQCAPIVHHVEHTNFFQIFKARHAIASEFINLVGIGFQLHLKGILLKAETCSKLFDEKSNWEFTRSEQLALIRFAGFPTWPKYQTIARVIENTTHEERQWAIGHIKSQTALEFLGRLAARKGGLTGLKHDIETIQNQSQCH